MRGKSPFAPRKFVLRKAKVDFFSEFKDNLSGKALAAVCPTIHRRPATCRSQTVPSN